MSIGAMLLRSHRAKIFQSSQNIYELMLGLQNIAELANSVCKAQLNRKTNGKHLDVYNTIWKYAFKSCLSACGPILCRISQKVLWCINRHFGHQTK